MVGDRSAEIIQGVAIAEIDTLSYFWENYTGLREDCFTVRDSA
jgi:hypothetical protein